MSRLVFAALLSVLALAAAAPAWALRPDEMLADPRLEARAERVGSELRCLVCRNQSVEESDADLAHDIRVLVRERIATGDTDAQVIAYIHSRYGDFVLLKPPLELSTLLLWGGPLLLLLIGAALVVRFYRRQSAVVAAAPLSDDERRRLATLIEDEAG